MSYLIISRDFRSRLMDVEFQPLVMAKMLLVPLLLVLFSFPVSAEKIAEKRNYFKTASTYTVKIRTRVKYPFIKDNKGSLSGAGSLISRKLGWIATNAHISSRNPASVEVAFKEGKFIEAQLHYVDHLLDLAILRIPPGKIPEKAQEAQTDCKDDPVVGSPAGAYGHPFSLSFSGTRGIVSGERYRWGRQWIQTDAPINRGNSGGPLISLDTGKVIGINSATFSKERSEGLGFAVPMSHACRVIQLLEKGIDPSPSYIPVSFAVDRDNESELRVAAVYREQPVVWPLKVGDRVIAFAKKPAKKLKNQADLIHSLRGMRENVKVIIERSGKRKSVSIKPMPRSNLKMRIGVHVSGIILGKQNFKDDEYMNPDGLLFIHDVAKASIGSLSGVSAYSYLVSVNGVTFKAADKLCSYLKKAEENNKKVLLVTRRTGWEYRAQSKYRSARIMVKDVKLVGQKAPENCDDRISTTAITNIPDG